MVFQFNPGQCCCNPCEVWSDNFDRASIGGDWTVIAGSWSIVDGALETSDNNAEIARAAGAGIGGSTRLSFRVWAENSGDVLKLRTSPATADDWLKFKFGTNQIEDDNGNTATVTLPVGEWVSVVVIHAVAFDASGAGVLDDVYTSFELVTVNGTVAYHRALSTEIEHVFRFAQNSGGTSTLRIDGVRFEQLWDQDNEACLRPDYTCWPVGTGGRPAAVLLTVSACSTTGGTPEAECDLLEGEYEATAVSEDRDRLLFDTSGGLPGSGPGSWITLADGWRLALDGSNGYDVLFVRETPGCGIVAIMSGNANTYLPCTIYHCMTTGGASAANEVQRVALQGAPTGGTFTLTFDGQTTGAIAYNASAATVQTALEGLSNIGVGDVSVSLIGSFPYYDWQVTFQSSLGNQNVPEMTGDGSSLTGGTSTDVTIWTTTAGSAPVGGTYTLTFDGQTTSGIAHNATAATVQAAIEALSNIAVGDVYCYDDGSGGVYIRFADTLAGTPQTLTIDDSGITGDGSPAKVLSEPWTIFVNHAASAEIEWQSSSIDRATNVVTLTGPTGDCDCTATLEVA